MESICAQCGTPLDQANESQPVCPECGEPTCSSYSLFGDDLGDFQAEDAHVISADLQSVIEVYSNDARGIRFQLDLQTVCLQCRSKAAGRSFLRCTNPTCNETWRVNHCGKCKKPVDSRDPETPQCPKCGWLKCAQCDSCNCVY
jgi:hypothetical protein